MQQAKPTLWVLLLSLLGPLLFGGCTDIRDYAGTWEGAVVPERAVRQGFTEHAEVSPLILDDVSLAGLSAHLTTSDGRFDNTRLVRVTKSAADEIADLSFGAGSLRTYFSYAQLADQPASQAAVVIISLFADDRIQLRIFRANDLYGVFHLGRR